MNESNIKFVVVGRPSDQAILGAEAPDSIKKTIKQEVCLFISKPIACKFARFPLLS